MFIESLYVVSPLPPPRLRDRRVFSVLISTRDLDIITQAWNAGTADFCSFLALPGRCL